MRFRGNFLRAVTCFAFLCPIIVEGVAVTLSTDDFKAWVEIPRVQTNLKAISTLLKRLVQEVRVTNPLISLTAEYRAQNGIPYYKSYLEYYQEIFAGFKALEDAELVAASFSQPNFNTATFADQEEFEDFTIPDEYDTESTIELDPPPLELQEIQKKFDGFRKTFQDIIDHRVQLKSDIWKTRQGQKVNVPTWGAIIDLVDTLEKNPITMTDYFSLALWIFNGSKKSVSGKNTMLEVSYNARNDLISAFYSLFESLSGMSDNLNELVVNIEKDLKYSKAKIGLIKIPILSFDTFIWPYNRTTLGLHDVIDRLRKFIGDLDWKGGFYDNSSTGS